MRERDQRIGNDWIADTHERAHLPSRRAASQSRGLDRADEGRFHGARVRDHVKVDRSFIAHDVFAQLERRHRPS